MIHSPCFLWMVRVKQKNELFYSLYAEGGKNKSKREFFHSFCFLIPNLYTGTIFSLIFVALFLKKHLEKNLFFNYIL